MTYPYRKTRVSKPKNQTRHAILLGLLTFMLTPLVALLVAVPLLLLENLSETFNPIIITAKIFGLQDLDGFFAAQFLFIGALALAGDFAAAIVSLKTGRSKKLAAITFFSALAFQCLALGTFLPITMKQSQKTMEAGIAREQAYAGYATVGDLRYEVHEPYSDQEITNLHPEYGPLYKTLEIIVPISVAQAGAYRVTVEYGYSDKGVFRSTRTKSVELLFAAGEQTVHIPFHANEVTGSYGHWSPAVVGGKVQTQLSFLVPKGDQTDMAKFVESKETMF